MSLSRRSILQSTTASVVASALPSFTSKAVAAPHLARLDAVAQAPFSVLRRQSNRSRSNRTGSANSAADRLWKLGNRHCRPGAELALTWPEMSGLRFPASAKPHRTRASADDSAKSAELANAWLTTQCESNASGETRIEIGNSILEIGIQIRRIREAN